MKKEDIAGHITPQPQDSATMGMVKSLLEWMEWETDGHGRWTRSVFWHGVEYTAKILSCRDCERTWPITFAIKDEVWNKVAHKKDILCLICFENRLGRPFAEEDFLAHADANVEILHLLTRKGKI